MLYICEVKLLLALCLQKSVLVNFTTTNVLDVKYCAYSTHLFECIKSEKVGHGGQRVKPSYLHVNFNFSPMYEGALV